MGRFCLCAGGQRAGEGAFLKPGSGALAFQAAVGSHGVGVADSSELTPFCSPVAGDRLSEKETEDLMAWMRNALGSRVTNVKVRPEMGHLPAAMALCDPTAAG